MNGQECTGFGSETDAEIRSSREPAAIPLDDTLHDEFRGMQREEHSIKESLRMAMDANLAQVSALNKRREQFWRECAERIGVDPNAVIYGDIRLKLDFSTEDEPKITFAENDDE